MAGFLVLLFAVIWVFIHFTGYGEFYDKMLCDDDDDDTDLTIKKAQE